MNGDKGYKFNILIQKYQNGELKGSQKALMDEWFDSLDSGEEDSWTASERSALREKIMARLESDPAVPLIRLPVRRRRVPYAAALLLLAIAGSFYFYGRFVNRTPTIDNLHTTVDQHDLPPGGNKATLTLADGRVVELSEVHDGIIIGDDIRYVEGSVVIKGGPKTEDKRAADNRTTQYAVLTIPRGGQYQVVLPDGSKVWLNSASTLRYPMRFTDGKREVELEGEAYFEIASRQNTIGNRIPFLVKTPNQTVEVLGTQFNISAYAEESETKTTLVDGEVRVSSAGSNASDNGRGDVSSLTSHISHLLSPGQESVLTPSGIQIRKANMESAIAWKSGIFHFDDTPFKQMMTQIARWYDIEVVYEGEAPAEVFSGKMSRNVNLGVLLSFLKDSGIDLRIEGNRLIVNN